MYAYITLSAIKRCNFCNILMWAWCVLLRSIFFTSACMQTDNHLGVVPRSHSSIKLSKWSCTVRLSRDPKAFFTTKSLSLKFLMIQIMFHLSTIFEHNSVLTFEEENLSRNRYIYGEMPEREIRHMQIHKTNIIMFLFVTLRMEL